MSYLLPTKIVQYKVLFFSILLIAIGYIFISKANFDTVAVSVVIDDKNVLSGDIVSLKAGKYVLASTEYDAQMFGVVVDDPALSIQDLDLKDAHYLLSSGQVFVRVSNSNGKIKKGDYLTSSTTAGVAIKALTTGQLLGVALEDYNPRSANDVGKINVLLNIRSAYVGNTSIRANLLQTLKSGSSSLYVTPIDSLRYVLAAIVVGATFLLGFTSFGRVSGNSLRALGRNPLASREIRIALIFNFALTFIIMVVGFGISYLMLIY